MKLPSFLANLISRCRPHSKKTNTSGTVAHKQWVENKHAHLRSR